MSQVSGLRSDIPSSGGEILSNTGFIISPEGISGATNKIQDLAPAITQAQDSQEGNFSQEERHLTFMTPEELETLKNKMQYRLPPVVRFMNTLRMCRLNNLDKDDRTCSICREDFKADGYTPEALGDGDSKLEMPLRLNCGHIFGNGCLSHWLSDNNNCPYCNRELFKKMPGIRTQAGLETRLGFLEVIEMRRPLEPEDRLIRDWLREMLGGLRELQAHTDDQEQRGSEAYGEPESD